MDLLATILNNQDKNREISDEEKNNIQKELSKNEYPKDLERILNLYKNNPDKNYIACFDTETTGFGHTINKLLEVAGVIYENGKIVDTFKFYTNPFLNPYDKSLPQKKVNFDYPFFKMNKDVKPQVAKIHGIDKKFLEKEKALHEDYYIPFIRNLLVENDNVTPIAHNFKFDIAFLTRLLEKEEDFHENIANKIKNIKSIDTQDLLREYQSNKDNGFNNKIKMLRAFQKVYVTLLNEYQNENEEIIKPIIENINKINEKLIDKVEIDIKDPNFLFIIDKLESDKEKYDKLLKIRKNNLSIENKNEIKVLKNNIIKFDKYKFGNTLDIFYLFALGVQNFNDIIKYNKTFDRSYHGGLIDSYMLGFVYQTYITQINIDAADIERQKRLEKELSNKIEKIISEKYPFNLKLINLFQQYDVYMTLIKDSKLSNLNFLIQDYLLDKDLTHLINKDSNNILKSIDEQIKDIKNKIIINKKNFKNKDKEVIPLMEKELELVTNMKNLEKLKSDIYNDLSPEIERIVNKYYEQGINVSLKRKTDKINIINKGISDVSFSKGTIKIEDFPKDTILMDTNNVNLGYYLDINKEKSKYGATIPLVLKLDKLDKNGNKLILADLSCFIKNEEGMYNLYGSQGSILNTLNYKKIAKPYITLDDLKKHDLKGLVFSTGSINGLIEQYIKLDLKDEIIPLLKELKNTFDDFVLESGNNDPVFNNYLSYLSKTLDIPLIATNTFIKANDKIHTIMFETLNLYSEEYGSYNPFNTNYSVNTNNEKRLGLYGNIIDLNEKLYEGELPTKDDELLLPKISNDPDKDLIDKTNALLMKYLEENPELDKDLYKKRLDKELKIINKMGFPSYLLITAEMVNFAHEHDIAVGPGRGSAAGSLAVFLLKITDLDPIKEGLIFERFLNPERVSMPDIDIDFDKEGFTDLKNIKSEEFRKFLSEKTITTKVKDKTVVDPQYDGKIENKDLLYEFVNNYYDRAYKVMTKGKFKGKSSIDGICKNLLESDTTVDNIKVSKDIKSLLVGADDPKFTLNKYFAETLENGEINKEKLEKLNINLFNLANEYKTIDIIEILNLALKLENTTRAFGIHPAGIAIDPSKKGIIGAVFTNKEGQLISNHTVDNIEYHGKLVKYDFLGLGTLQVIVNTLDLIKSRKKSLDIKYLKNEINSLKDKKIYDFIQTGNTIGLFQIESTGMQGLCKSLKPDTFEELSAVLALYRPGPMESGMIDNFTNRKNGKEELVYFKEEIKELIFEKNKDKPKEIKEKLFENEYSKVVKMLEPILKSTYGVIVFQEQVMSIVQEMAGYSLGEADIIRRAMGKKKDMSIYRDDFALRSEKKGITKETAAMVFNLIEKFAGYGFNKSHSSAYAKLTYQTAYLKTYHPLEFYTSVLNFKENKQDELAIIYNDLKKYNLEHEEKIILNKVDINVSEKYFVVKKNKIFYGFNSLKGIGQNADKIIKERELNGPFKTYNDALDRLLKVKMNKQGMEGLILSGAFDLLNIDNIDNSKYQISQKRKLMLSLFYDANNGGTKQKTIEINNIFDLIKEERRITGGFLTADKIPLNTNDNLSSIRNNPKRNINKNEDLKIGILEENPYLKYQKIKPINEKLYEYAILSQYTNSDIQNIKSILKEIYNKNELFIKNTNNEKRINTLSYKNEAINNTLNTLDKSDINTNTETLELLHNSLNEIYERNLGKNEGKNIVRVPFLLDDKTVILNISSSVLTDEVIEQISKLKKKDTIFINAKFYENEYNGKTTLWITHSSLIDKINNNDVIKIEDISLNNEKSKNKQDNEISK